MGDLLVVRDIRSYRSKLGDAVKLFLDGILRSDDYRLNLRVSVSRNVASKLYSKELLTMCSWCRMGPGEDRLSLSTLSLKRCKDGSNLITRFSIIIDLLLEVHEDLGINHSCYAGVGHFDVEFVI